MAVTLDHRYVWALRASLEPHEVPETPQASYVAPSVTDVGELVIAVPAADDPTEVASGPQLEADPSEELIFGRTLSFDWRAMRFRRRFDGDPVIVEEAASLLEDVLKMILTPRFRVAIYDSDYGCELQDMIGLDRPTAEAQVTEAIRSTLLVDPRISGVQSLIDPTYQAEGGMKVSIVVTDFQGRQLAVPDVLVRYGGSVA